MLNVESVIFLSKKSNHIYYISIFYIIYVCVCTFAYTRVHVCAHTHRYRERALYGSLYVTVWIHSWVCVAPKCRLYSRLPNTYTYEEMETSFLFHLIHTFKKFCLFPTT